MRNLIVIVFLAALSSTVQANASNADLIRDSLLKIYPHLQSEPVYEFTGNDCRAWVSISKSD